METKELISNFGQLVEASLNLGPRPPVLLLLVLLNKNLLCGLAEVISQP